MNYHKIYNQLIESRTLLNRNRQNGIFEKHHIIPKCLGGSDKKENLILLTPREHFMAHLLLTQMYTGKDKKKMCYALRMMCRPSKKYKNRNISSSQYEFAKLIEAEY